MYSYFIAFVIFEFVIYPIVLKKGMC